MLLLTTNCYISTNTFKKKKKKKDMRETYKIYAVFPGNKIYSFVFAIIYFEFTLSILYHAAKPIIF